MTHTFDPAKYGPEIAALLSEPRLMPLGPGTPVVAVRDRLATLPAPPACRAGLWLYFDFLDEAHQISQADEADPDHNFWHAVLHRREPDAWNSKYWWRRVGPHPVLDRLRERAAGLGFRFTTPEAFVDLCERVRGTGTDAEGLARRVQLLEWQLHFDWCWDHADR
jgi:hypothetical protein